MQSPLYPLTPFSLLFHSPSKKPNVTQKRKTQNAILSKHYTSCLAEQGWYVSALITYFLYQVVTDKAICLASC